MFYQTKMNSLLRTNILGVRIYVDSYTYMSLYIRTVGENKQPRIYCYATLRLIIGSSTKYHTVFGYSR